MTAVLAGLLGAGGVALVGAATGRFAHERATKPASVARLGDEQSILVRLRPGLCALALIGGWVVFGGALGAALGAVGALLSWRALERLESPAAVRRRQELERDLPVAVHLLASCLAAGSDTGGALASVADALPGAVAEEFLLLQRRLHWGVDPVSVWRSVAGPLEPLGRSLARAHESGASVQHAVARLAVDLRGQSRLRADSRARTIEVKAAAPLGLCLLPAFVLLGVIPMIAALFSSLDMFR